MTRLRRALVNLAGAFLIALTHRRQHGSYPRRLNLDDRGLNYGSDGTNYWLWTMDPLVCGHVWSYGSPTREWRESHDPCYY